MKIALGADHAGYALKQAVKAHLERRGIDTVDFGTDSEVMVDYPLFIRPAAQAVQRGACDRGIVFGGSGNGEAIVANRLAGIRCAVCWDVRSAGWASSHNNANLLALGARLVDVSVALQIVDTWLATPFEGGRHDRRLRMIDAPDASAL